MVGYHEKRDFLRMPIDCIMVFNVVDDKRKHRGHVVNLSSKGILFTTRQKLEVGAFIRVQLTSGDKDVQEFRALFEVTRITSHRINYEVAGKLMEAKDQTGA